MPTNAHPKCKAADYFLANCFFLHPRTNSLITWQRDVKPSSAMRTFPQRFLYIVLSAALHPAKVPDDT